MIDAQSKKGVPVQELVRRHSRRWDGNLYVACPAKTIRLSPVSLKRIYYRWKRSPETALRFQYASGASRKIPRALILEVLRRAPRHLSLQSVLRSIEVDFKQGKKMVVP